MKRTVSPLSENKFTVHMSCSGPRFPTVCTAPSDGRWFMPLMFELINCILHTTHHIIIHIQVHMSPKTSPLTSFLTLLVGHFDALTSLYFMSFSFAGEFLPPEYLSVEDSTG